MFRVPDSDGIGFALKLGTHRVFSLDEFKSGASLLEVANSQKKFILRQFRGLRLLDDRNSFRCHFFITHDIVVEIFNGTIKVVLRSPKVAQLHHD